jgi:hypothetical protein
MEKVGKHQTNGTMRTMGEMFSGTAQTLNYFTPRHWGDLTET